MMNTILFIGGLGAPEIILLVLLVLLLFGGKKIPELARGLGRGIREFNSAKASIEEEIREGSKLEIKEKVKEENRK
jgi:sec-independent protein translocase protein TatA